MTTQSKTVKLSELSIDQANVRKTGRGSEPKFAASIRAMGVIEPMIVRQSPNSGYTIINGGERYTALEWLKKKGEKANGVLVTDDYQVKVEVATKDDAAARATSLATNLIRADMHPVDEFEAFAQMIKDGATVESLAAQYARTVPEIRQALSLAAIAPEIRKAWRDGEIGGDAAEAYAQTKDLEHQVRVFKKLKKRAGEAWAVTEEIAGDDDRRLTRLLRFVTPHAYEAAGHHVNPSLFPDEDDEDATVIGNVPALKAMAARKLDEELLKLKADGWGWAVTRDDAPKDLYAWRRLPNSNPPKAQKALAGCTVEIDHSGKLEIVRGYVKPGVSVKIEKTPAQKAAARKAGPANPGAISAALTTRMSEALTRATASVVGGVSLDTALRIALAGLICASTHSDSPVCLENKGAGARDQDDADGYMFEVELARVGKMKLADLAKLFAKTVGASIELSTHDQDRMLTDAEGDVEADVAALVHFVPQNELQAALLKEFDPADYFDNAPGSKALAALADMGVDPIKNVKKAALAKQAADAAKKKGWLPPQLRTAFYAGPVAPKKKAKASRKKRR